MPRYVCIKPPPGRFGVVMRVCGIALIATQASTATSNSNRNEGFLTHNTFLPVTRPQAILGITSKGNMKIAYTKDESAWKNLPSYLQSGPMLVYNGKLSKLEDKKWNKVRVFVCKWHRRLPMGGHACRRHSYLEPFMPAPPPCGGSPVVKTCMPTARIVP